MNVPRYLGLVASPVECEQMAQSIFPDFTKCVAPTRGRDGCKFFYRVYLTNVPADRTFRDPLNGDTLVICKTFISEDALLTWVDEHDRVTRGPS